MVSWRASTQKFSSQREEPEDIQMFTTLSTWYTISTDEIASTTHSNQHRPLYFYQLTNMIADFFVPFKQSIVLYRDIRESIIQKEF